MKPTTKYLREQYTRTVEAGGLEWVVRKLDAHDIGLAYGRLIICPDASAPGGVRQKRRDEFTPEDSSEILDRLILAAVVEPPDLDERTVRVLPGALRDKLGTEILEFAGLLDRPFAGAPSGNESCSIDSVSGTEAAHTTT